MTSFDDGRTFRPMLRRLVSYSFGLAIKGHLLLSGSIPKQPSQMMTLYQIKRLYSQRITHTYLANVFNSIYTGGHMSHL